MKCCVSGGRSAHARPVLAGHMLKFIQRPTYFIQTRAGVSKGGGIWWNHMEKTYVKTTTLCHVAAPRSSRRFHVGFFSFSRPQDGSTEFILPRAGLAGFVGIRPLGLEKRSARSGLEVRETASGGGAMVRRPRNEAPDDAMHFHDSSI